MPVARPSTSFLTFLLLVCGLQASGGAHAAEDYANCTAFIDALPATIGASGHWCLRGDLSTGISSGAAISVNASNVVLDCNDFKVGGLAAGAGTATIGVQSFNRDNITVRRCSIRGFRKGIELKDNTSGVHRGHLIEDNRFDANTQFGMEVWGDNSIVRRNRVFDTGGSTAFTLAAGIFGMGNIDVLDNLVSGLAPRNVAGNHAHAIWISNAQSSSTSGNRIRGLVKAVSSNISGIYQQVSDDVVMRGNQLHGGGTGTLGIICGDAAQSPSDRLVGNVVIGFATATSNCITTGGNNITTP